MESQDTVTLYFLKIWTAFEANKNRFIGGAIAVVLLILLVLFLSWQRDQKEINAGQALSQLVVSPQPNSSPAQLAARFLKIANDYTGTQAAQRAQLETATVLFSSGDYSGALTQFQKFTETYPTSPLLPTANLGLAAALEAQGKLDAAADAYQKVLGASSAVAAMISAQFALGRIDEQQGKLNDALKYYQEVAHSVPSTTTLGHQAAVKAAEIGANLAAKVAATPVVKMPAATPAVKMPATAPVTTPAAKAPVATPAK